MPIVIVRDRRNPRAKAFGMYASSLAASKIRCRVSARADTVGSPLSTRDAIETVTPDAAATSVSRGRPTAERTGARTSAPVPEAFF